MIAHSLIISLVCCLDKPSTNLYIVDQKTVKQVDVGGSEVREIVVFLDRRSFQSQNLET